MPTGVSNIPVAEVGQEFSAYDWRTLTLVANAWRLSEISICWLLCESVLGRIRNFDNIEAYRSMLAVGDEINLRGTLASNSFHIIRT